MSVEAFIFDIGNVLLTFDYGRVHQALREAGVTVTDLPAVQELALRYERGTLGNREFLASLSFFAGHALPEEDLVRAWQDIFEPNEPMWKVVEALHGQYPLYLLSNTNRLQHDHIVERYGIFAKFADGVYSYRAKMMKPEPEIFETAIRRFGVRPETTVYIDDIPANVDAARAAGLRALCYHPHAHGEFLAALRTHGVQCV